MSGNSDMGERVSFETYRTFIETRSAEVVANIALCLIHQANYLLDQQIRRLEQDFVKEGGLRERMARSAAAERTAATKVLVLREVRLVRM